MTNKFLSVLKFAIVLACFGALSTIVFAADLQNARNTPSTSNTADENLTGDWVMFDDDGKTPSALIAIRFADGEYRGSIKRVFANAAAPVPERCTKCKGVNKDKPLVGLEIISGVKKTGTKFSNGDVLDPFSGDTASIKIEPNAKDKTLDVTFFIGLPILGQKEVWKREAALNAPSMRVAGQ
jgi:uncharacterized protein (DUF2147 family)